MKNEMPNSRQIHRLISNQYAVTWLPFRPTKYAISAGTWAMMSYIVPTTPATIKMPPPKIDIIAINRSVPSLTNSDDS